MSRAARVCVKMMHPSHACVCFCLAVMSFMGAVKYISGYLSCALKNSQKYNLLAFLLLLFWMAFDEYMFYLVNVGVLFFNTPLSCASVMFPKFCNFVVLKVVLKFGI